jgi:hypothetical protein
MSSAWKTLRTSSIAVIVALPIAPGCVQGDAADGEEALAASEHALARDRGDVWRPFNAASPWNTRIEAKPTRDPDSDAMIADWQTSSPFGGQLGVNLQGYSIPLYWADASTPKARVRCDVGGLGFEGEDGMNAEALIPMPAEAEPDPLGDRHLLVVDRSSDREWGLWHASRNEDGWRCGVGADIDLGGDGLRPPAEDNDTWYTSQGPRACGFPLSAGLIRPEEIAAGRIEHALVLAYPHIRSGLYTSPASTAQSRIGDEAIKTRGIPCGGRVQLDPALDLDALGLSTGASVIARALMEYGAYVGDYSGSNSLYADNSRAAREAWEALPISDISRLDLASFHVLELGELHDNGNGD